MGGHDPHVLWHDTAAPFEELQLPRAGAARVEQTERQPRDPRLACSGAGRRLHSEHAGKSGGGGGDARRIGRSSGPPSGPFFRANLCGGWLYGVSMLKSELRSPRLSYLHDRPNPPVRVEQPPPPWHTPFAKGQHAVKTDRGVG